METHQELNPKLKIYGSRIHEYQNLLRLAENLGISGRVEFCGFATDWDLPLVYNSLDVLVLPSDWEGFGFPIIEAQRCGVPVVIRTDARISPEIGQCCLKVDSEEDMSNKIVQILTDTTMRDRIIQEGLKYTRRFTWDWTVKETIAMYEKVLS
jgi:glycosyltransferase involved in cell wall biosynthesis